jgi:hypothetical protein
MWMANAALLVLCGVVSGSLRGVSYLQQQDNLPFNLLTKYLVHRLVCEQDLSMTFEAQASPSFRFKLGIPA